MNRTPFFVFALCPLLIFSSFLDACSAIDPHVADSHATDFTNLSAEVVPPYGSKGSAAREKSTGAQQMIASSLSKGRPKFKQKMVFLDGTVFPHTDVGLESALQQACDGLTPGVVVLPAREMISSHAAIAVPNNCTLVGHGVDSIIQGSFAGPMLTNANANPRNITFRNFCLDGDSSTSPRSKGILFPGVESPTDILIDNVYVRNVGGNGITIYGSPSAIGHGLIIHGVHVLNAGKSAAPQLVGISFREINDVQISDTEVTGAGLVYGITGFDSIPTSAANAVHNISIDRWWIHDIGQILRSGGTAIDIGRVRQVRVSNGICLNVASGECITFESVWHGTAIGNIGVDEAIPAPQSMVLVTNPDTTVPGEVGSRDIVFKDNVWHCGWVGIGSCETVNRSVDGVTFQDSIVFNSTAPVAGVFLQPGSTDPNIVASGWGQGRNINVFSRVENKASLTNNLSVCVCIIQPTTQVIDNINIQNSSARGCHFGVAWSSTSAADGIANMIIHGMDFLYDKIPIESLDAHRYNSIYFYDNLTPLDTGTPIEHLPF